MLKVATKTAEYQTAGKFADYILGFDLEHCSSSALDFKLSSLSMLVLSICAIF